MTVTILVNVYTCTTSGRKVYVEHTCVKFAYTRYFHVHSTPFYAPPPSPTGGAMDEVDVRVPLVLYSISHLLYAVLGLGRAMCNMKNSMLVTPLSACVVRTIVARPGVGIMRNIHVVRCVNIVDFLRTAGNARNFPPGIGQECICKVWLRILFCLHFYLKKYTT